MCPDFPSLVKCPGCYGLLWLAEARTLGEIANLLTPPEMFRGSLPHAALTEEEYLKVLAEIDLPRHKESYVRIRAWWSANDLVRKEADPRHMPCAFSRQQLANLEKLSSLLDETAPGDRLLKAEIARECGRFEEAAVLLTFSFPPDWADSVDLLRLLCHRRITGVVDWAAEQAREQRTQRIGELAKRVSEMYATVCGDVSPFLEECRDRFVRALCGLVRALPCGADGRASFSAGLDHLDVLARLNAGDLPASPQEDAWYYLRAAVAELSVVCHRCLKTLLDTEAPLITLMKLAYARGFVEREHGAEPLRAFCGETAMSAPQLDLDFVISGTDQAMRLFEAAAMAQKKQRSS